MRYYPRPEVLDSIPLDRSAVIEASAGTGKTFTIEHLVVEMLLATDATIGEILVLTFTDKATAELRKRIRSMLTRILTGAGEDRIEPAWKIDQVARDKLEAALLAFDTASIHTIHGFYQRVLTSNAFLIGRPLVQELVDGRTAFGRAFRAALSGAIAVEPGLRRHLEAWLSDLGKSLESLEDLAFRCLSHHRKGTPFWPAHDPEALVRVLASRPLPPRVDAAALKSEAAGVHASTIKAAAARIEWLHDLLGGARPPDPLALLAAFGEKVSFRKQDRAKLDAAGVLFEELAQASGTAAGWHELIRELLEHAASVESAVVEAVLPAVVHELDRERAERGLFDFDDLIRLVWEALSGPVADVLAEQLRARYRFALIDEFQDTDELQWRIFRKLFLDTGAAGPSPAGDVPGTPPEGPERHGPGARGQPGMRDAGQVMFLVGDPKQSIYAFRGADVETYLEATRHLRSLHGQPPVLLSRSYRATAPLIAAQNLLFAQDVPEPFFTDPSIRYLQPVECGRPELALVTASGEPAPPVVVLSLIPEGPIPRIQVLRRALAAAIAADIAGLLDEGSPESLVLGPPDAGRRIRPSDIFVLTRSASEGYQLGEFLRAAGVPYAFYKQEGLFATREARDVRDVLLAVLDPGDASRRFKAWLSPFFDVPLDAMAAMAELPPTHPLVQQLEEWHELARRGDPERLFGSLADDSGLTRRLLEATQERELTNYLHLFEILLSRAQAGIPLEEIVIELGAWIAGDRRPPGENADIQRLQSDREAVQIMTMHKSKGLEADVVYLFGGFSEAPARSIEPVLLRQEDRRVLHIGRAPAAALHRARERELEHQRLLYVALTRARGRLVVPLLPASLRSMSGSPYEVVNRRLTRILESGESPELFAVRPVPLEPGSAGEGRVRPATGPRAPEWPAEPPASSEPDEMARLAREHEPLRVTSYSRIKRAAGGYVSPLDAELLMGDGAAPDPVVAPEVEPDALPGGVAMGILLHSIIEDLPLRTFAGAPPVEAWSALPEVGELMAAKLAQSGTDPGLRPAIERLIHRSLTAPVRIGTETIAGFASVTASAREMEFLFPWPEREHPALTQAPGGRLVVQRGYVQGVIDLVFEVRGRFYFADWKTDILPDYGTVTIAGHVVRNYQLQARLYALAVVKMLAIRDRAAYEARFGGLLYCFLRGMQPAPGGASPGVYFERPRWEELVAFEARMRSGEDLA